MNGEYSHCQDETLAQLQQKTRTHTYIRMNNATKYMQT